MEGEGERGRRRVQHGREGGKNTTEEDGERVVDGSMEGGREGWREG